MTRFLVLLTEEPHYIKCLDEKEALQVATENQEILICIATSSSHISVKIPKLAMAFENEHEEILDDYLGEKLIDELREIEVDVTSVLGNDSDGYITEHKEK